MIEVADAVSQRANGKVFGCVGHEVPNHSLTWRNTASVTIKTQFILLQNILISLLKLIHNLR